jgi:hypothetical protein
MRCRGFHVVAVREARVMMQMGSTVRVAAPKPQQFHRRKEDVIEPAWQSQVAVDEIVGSGAVTEERVPGYGEDCRRPPTERGEKAVRRNAQKRQRQYDYSLHVR